MGAAGPHCNVPDRFRKGCSSKVAIPFGASAPCTAGPLPAAKIPSGPGPPARCARLQGGAAQPRSKVGETMGTFYGKCKIENPADRTRSAVIPKLLIDTGSEFTWVSERTLERLGIQREKKDVSFVLANGQHVTRSVGFAIIRLDKYFTIDEVVFAEPGDLSLLGARTLEGLNLTIDPGRRRLVAAGPLPAASPTSQRLTSALHPTRKKPRAGKRRL